jgi:hypothetical protein
MNKEKILNIYLIIENKKVVGFAAKEYFYGGSDQKKIEFLKERAKFDFEETEEFGAPVNKLGKFMSYRKFHKLEKRGLHYQLFEEVFSHYQLGDSPLVCVTPVLDGKILAQ